MKTFGLTGGIGMGKSAAAQILAGRGVAVVDTDQLARQLTEPGRPALADIQNQFGPDIVAPDGRLRRGELARLVFADVAARQKLEAILHPRIRQAWLAQVAAWRTEGRPMAVVVIPLLFETAADAQFDRIICLACSEATQRERLRARGWTEEQIAARNAAQWPIADKMERAHQVIWTEGTVAALADQLERVMA